MMTLTSGVASGGSGGADCPTTTVLVPKIKDGQHSYVVAFFDYFKQILKCQPKSPNNYFLNVLINISQDFLKFPKIS